MKRRKFIASSSGALLGSGLRWPSQMKFSSENVIPMWRGFNLLDFFNPDPANARPQTKEKYFQWMADWGFDFVRIPMAYPSYLKFDRSKPIRENRIRKVDRKQVEKIEHLVFLAHKYNLHVSLNLHRAPGFCVNAGFEEPYNLWQDPEALDDFCWHWKFWARKFKNFSPEKISFDLLNEPCLREDMNDQHSKRSAIPGHQYRQLTLRAAEVIHKQNPGHLIIADGNNIGRDVINEIVDLEIAQSCRGYHPGIISHYQASWVYKDPSKAPKPVWPGQVGDRYLSRAILEEFYAPWIALKDRGIGVHCGECGCYNKTPHQIFLAWFEDVIDILTSEGIGYALWNFSGAFGLLNSGRADVDYENIDGEKLDRRLLTLLQRY